MRIIIKSPGPRRLPTWLAWVALALTTVAVPPASNAEEVQLGKCEGDLARFRSFQPFYKDGVTYIFAQRSLGSAEDMFTHTMAATWWQIKSDAKYGYTCFARAKMSSEHEGVKTFTIGGNPYLYGLHEGVGPVVWRFFDKPGSDFAVRMYKKWPFKRTYRDMLFFTLSGQTYALSRWEKGANIWHVQDVTGKGVSFALHVYATRMSQKHRLHGVFYVNGLPHIIASHPDVGTTIWRVESSPPGSKEPLRLVHLSSGKPSLKGYDYVLPFHLQNRPYLLAVTLTRPLLEVADAVEQGGSKYKPEEILRMIDQLVQWGEGRGVIYAIEGTAQAPTVRRLSKAIPMSHRYLDITTFEQSGKAYIFGVHETGHANIWEIAADPANGFSVIYDGKHKRPVGP
jgi:hypothetical protein